MHSALSRLKYVLWIFISLLRCQVTFPFKFILVLLFSWYPGNLFFLDPNSFCIALNWPLYVYAYVIGALHSNQSAPISSSRFNSFFTLFLLAWSLWCLLHIAIFVLIRSWAMTAWPQLHKHFFYFLFLSNFSL